MDREIANELLRQVGFECEAFIKDKQRESGVKFLQADVDTIIDSFVSNEDVRAEKTVLTVTPVDLSVSVTGTIKPVGCIEVINVDTVIE